MLARRTLAFQLILGCFTFHQGSQKFAFGANGTVIFRDFLSAVFEILSSSVGANCQKFCTIYSFLP